MENKKLGRGLEQLFSSQPLDLESMEKSIVETAKESDIVELNLSELRSNPYQPRTHFDEEALKDLAESIKEYGVIEPVIVRKSIKGYDIIAGERRVKASKIAGKTTIPAIIKDFTDGQMMEVALLENIQREDLSAIETAIALKNIIDELNITQEELGKRIGKSRSYITNMLGLLRLPNDVKKMVSNGLLTMGHARALSKLEDDGKMSEIATRVVSEGLTVRNVEDIVSEPIIKKKNPTVKVSHNEYEPVQRIMREKVGTMVKISSKKIEIPFKDEKDLERILELLNIKLDL